MGKITQYSRISHHTVSLTGFTGTTLFTVPPSEDFTNGTWSIYDLALSEIGVWEEQERAYIRIGNNIKEFNLIPSGSSGTNLWVSGSSGSFSIAANNPTGVDATGNYAVAAGLNNLSQGIGSVSFGRDNTAIDSFTSAFGFNNTVSGITSFVGGNSLDIAAQNAAAFGFNNRINGDGGFSAGYNNRVDGLTSAAFGNGNLVTGNDSGAFGNGNDVSGTYGFAIGQTNTASGTNSFAEGKSTVASGNVSHAEGEQSQATGLASHAEGSNTLSSGQASHSEGSLTIASGDYSHAGGNLSVASGLNSFAHGFSASATTTGSTAIGSITLANGSNSFAGGTQGKDFTPTIASGVTAFAFGEGAKAYGDLSVAFGTSVVSGTSSVGFIAANITNPGVFSIASTSSSRGEYSHANNTIYGQDGVFNVYRSIPPSSADTFETFVYFGPFLPPTSYERISIPNDAAYYCEIRLGITDASGNTKEFRGDCLIKNIGGTTTMVGSSGLTSVYGDAAFSTITASMVADDTNDSLNISVTTPTATFDDINVHGTIRYNKVNIQP